MGYVIDTYLDDLFDRLAGTGAGGRRALVETEDHLRAAADEAIACGVEPIAAERNAVDRFGPSSRIAGGFQAVHNGPIALLRQAFVGCWLVAALAFVAIGLSGAIAYAFGRWFGIAFVSGDAVGSTYTLGRCADFTRFHPEAATCAAAAAAHHFDEVVGYRADAGLLGACALVALWFARRFTSLGSTRGTPPRGTLITVVIALFGLDAAVTVGPPVMAAAFGAGTDGLGAQQSAGLVSAAVVLAALLVALSGRHRSPAAAQ
jgi:hypothetical protein